MYWDSSRKFNLSWFLFLNLFLSSCPELGRGVNFLMCHHAYEMQRQAFCWKGHWIRSSKWAIYTSEILSCFQTSLGSHPITQCGNNLIKKRETGGIRCSNFKATKVKTIFNLFNHFDETTHCCDDDVSTDKLSHKITLLSFQALHCFLRYYRLHSPQWPCTLWGRMTVSYSVLSGTGEDMEPCIGLHQGRQLSTLKSTHLSSQRFLWLFKLKTNHAWWQRTPWSCQCNMYMYIYLNKYVYVLFSLTWHGSLVHCVICTLHCFDL